MNEMWKKCDVKHELCSNEFSIPDQNIKASNFCTKKIAKRTTKSTSIEINGEKLKWPDASSPK